MTRQRKPLREGDYRYPGQPDDWIKSDWFCPSCGVQDMWQRTSGGDDYYHQYSVTCHTCTFEMCCVDKVDA